MTLMEYQKHMRVLETLTDSIIGNERIARNEKTTELKTRYQGYAETDKAKIIGYLWAIKVSAGEEARDKLEEYMDEYEAEKKKGMEA